VNAASAERQGVGAHIRKSVGWRALSALLAGIALLAACSQGGGAGQSGAASACAFAPQPGVFARYLGAYAGFPTYAPVNATGATSAQWPYFFQPATVAGPPCGTNASGLFDGISLGYDASVLNAQGGSLVVGLGDAAGPRCAVDDSTTAPDLVVYGNQFFLNAGGAVYPKIATVDVTDVLPADPAAATWHRFPPSFNPAACNLSYPANVQSGCYMNFAGVLPTSVGGDRFDLSDPGIVPPLPPSFQACYVRITDGGTLYPDYGDTQTDLYQGGAAIDAVQALTSVAAPALTP
jgi:hypothetical protein